MPKRIQRTREKGWRLPPNTKIVSRPTRWGNPFVVQRHEANGIIWYRVERDGEPVSIMVWDTPGQAASQAVDRYRDWLLNGLAASDPEEDAPDDWAWFACLDLEELRGKDLACWCPLVDEHGNHVPCHADVLLQLANP